MRNIICNNCVGARLYQVSNKQFPNPFMWCSEDSKEFRNLINSYDNIDLNDVTFEFEMYRDRDYKSVLVKIPNAGKEIGCHFIHYALDETKSTPEREKKTNNVWYREILDYAREKWFKRLKRMNEEPVFLIIHNFKTELKDFEGLNTSHKIIVFTPQPEEAKAIFPEGTEVIKEPPGAENWSTMDIAKFLLSKHKALFF